METGAHVWLRSPHSEWGWVPALIVDREEIVEMVRYYYCLLLIIVVANHSLIRLLF